MRRGFWEFVQDNPFTEEEGKSLFPAVETEEERLKRQIVEAIDRGYSTADTLKDCLSLIGTLSHDQAWADRMKAKLDKTEKPITELDIPI